MRRVIMERIYFQKVQNFYHKINILYMQNIHTSDLYFLQNIQS